jgi:hypothetical protein
MVVHRDDVGRVDDRDAIASAAASSERARGVGWGFVGRRMVGGAAQRITCAARGGGRRASELGFEARGITDERDCERATVKLGGTQSARDLGNGRAIAAHGIDYDSHDDSRASLAERRMVLMRRTNESDRKCSERRAFTLPPPSSR